MSDSLWPTRLLSPWGSPGNNTGVGCRALLQVVDVCLQNEFLRWFKCNCLAPVHCKSYKRKRLSISTKHWDHSLKEVPQENKQTNKCGLFGVTFLIQWRRKWQPTPEFLPRESHGWRSFVGYSPRVAESDTTKRLHFHFSHSVQIGVWSLDSRMW